MTREQIWAAITAERARQAAKWGGEHTWGHGDCSSTGVSDAVKAAVLAEECGEVARAALDGTMDLAEELGASGGRGGGVAGVPVTSVGTSYPQGTVSHPRLPEVTSPNR